MTAADTWLALCLIETWEPYTSARKADNLSLSVKRSGKHARKTFELL